jgi:uncharacterized membrane protein YbhN (UPF0104 family)
VTDVTGRTPRPARRPARDATRFQLFSSSNAESRARRPTDVALLLVSVLGLGVVLLVARSSINAEAPVADLVALLPGLLDGLWEIFSDLVVVWATGLFVVALLARRFRLARDLLLAAIISAGVTLAVTDGAAAARLAVAAAVVTTASPHLARPWRHAGRWVVTLAAFSAVFLTTTSVGRAFVAIGVANTVAAAVHLAFGSPGGRPTLDRIEAMLSDLGITASHLQPAALQPEGEWVVDAELESGEPVRVKVYGRDAWDNQLVMALWRSIWYRDTTTAVSFARVQLVEHEAFLILLARQAGLDVPTVLAAGETQAGDAVLVVDATATALDETSPPADDVVAGLWHALDTAHGAGLSPGRVEPGAIGATASGTAVLLDWAGGHTLPTDEQRLQDGAQLLVSTAMVVGQERALATARAALGQERLEQLLPYLQPAGMSRTIRRELRVRKFDLDALRASTAESLTVELPELVQLRRVTWGSVLQAALLFLAAFFLINGLSAIDFAAVADEFRDMAIGAVVVGVILTQLARAAGALSNLGASPAPLPVGPVLQLQFAIAYINMAVPSSAGRLALVIRFYQRVGSTAVTAIGAGTLDSLANFVVQVVLIVATLGFGAGTVELDISSATDDLSSKLLRLVGIVLVVVVLMAIVVLLVPKLRHRVIPTIHQLREALAVLHSPRNWVLLLGGNLLVQVVYSMALAAFVAATGHGVGLVDLLLIINIVGTLAAIIPVPNGMGVQEAGLTAGLVACGVPQPAALAAALAYRVFSSYLSPVWGYFAMRSLQRHDYL